MDDAQKRSLRASYAANTRWAQETDRTDATAKAREKFAQRFVEQVDPERTLAPDELARRVAEARTAHYRKLGLARAAKRGISDDERRRVAAAEAEAKRQAAAARAKEVHKLLAQNEPPSTW